MWKLKKKRSTMAVWDATLLSFSYSRLKNDQPMKPRQHKQTTGRWWFQKMFHLCLFTPKIGEDEPILTNIFFKWVETTNQKKHEVIHFVFSLLAV